MWSFDTSLLFHFTCHTVLFALTVAYFTWWLHLYTVFAYGIIVRFSTRWAGQDGMHRVNVMEFGKRAKTSAIGFRVPLSMIIISKS